MRLDMPTEQDAKNQESDKFEPISGDRTDIKICYAKQLSKNHQVFQGLIQENESETPVAIKLVPYNEVQSREVEILLELPKHENIICYHTSVTTTNPPTVFIVMEQCKENLGELIQKATQPLAHVTKKTILLHIAKGLCHLHNNKILHRDLKPQNLLLSMDGKFIKMCDFGLSKNYPESDTPLTKSAKNIGTEGWGSPESYENKEGIGKMSTKSDVFSAGLVFFFVMSDGKHPCGEHRDEWTMKIQDKEEIFDLDKLQCDEDDDGLVRHLISKMLEKTPENRPKSDHVLKHALFWDLEKRVEFVAKVAGNDEQTINRHLSDICSHVKVPDGWLGCLKNELADTEQTEVSRKALEKVQVVASQDDEKRKSLRTFLELFQHLHEEFQDSDGSDPSYEPIWKIFFRCCPDIFVDMYRYYWEIKTEETMEDFQQFETEPKQVKLVPAIKDIKTTPRGQSVLISWNHESDDDVSYAVKAFYDYNDVRYENTKEKEYTLKGAKSSSSIRIEICAVDVTGSRSPVFKSIINTPPGRPKEVTAEDSQSAITVNWKGDEDDSSSTFYARIVKMSRPGVEEEFPPIRVNERPFKWKFPSPSHSFTFTMYAISQEGIAGPDSEPACVKTKPSIVRNINVDNHEKFKVTWDKPENEEVTYRLQCYRNGELSKAGVSDIPRYEYVPPVTSLNDEYEFEVWAESAFGVQGDRAKSEKISLSPNPIREPKISVVGHCFKLQWDATHAKYGVRVLADRKVLGEEIIENPHYDYVTPIPNALYQFQIWGRNERGVDGPVTELGPVAAGTARVNDLNIAEGEDKLHLSWIKPNAIAEEAYTLSILRRNIGKTDEGEEIKEAYTTDASYQYAHPLPSTQYKFEIHRPDPKKTSKIATSKWITTRPAKVGKLRLEVIKGLQKFKASWIEAKNHRYRVTVFCNGNRGTTMDAVDNFYEFSGEKHKRYFVRVSAINKEQLCGQEAQSKTTMLPPGIVDGVKHTFEDGLLKISWDSLDEATFYIVTVTSSGNETTSETEATEISFPAPKSGQFSYTVQAKNQYGEVGEHTEPVTTEPPLPVETVEVKYQNKKLFFTWQSPFPNKYRIVLKSKSSKDGKYSIVIDEETKNCNFEFAPKFSKRYWFSVTVIEGSGKERINSESKSCYYGMGPDRVKLTKLIHAEGRILLAWEHDDEGVEYFLEIFHNGRSVATKNLGTQKKYRLSEPEGSYFFQVWAKNWLGLEGEKSRSSEIITIKEEAIADETPMGGEKEGEETLLLDSVSDENAGVLLANEDSSGQQQRKHGCFRTLRNLFCC